jgi:WD40 repeat protein
MKAHDEDITKLVWVEEDQILMTSGKDKLIKVWKLPDVWRNKAL